MEFRHFGLFIMIFINKIQLSSAQEQWHAFQGKAYYVYSGAGINFTNANVACRTRNAQLPVITSAAQNEFIRSRLDSNIYRRYWLNLQAPTPLCSCSISTDVVCRQCRESWQWWDGTDMTYWNWKSGRPQAGGRQCVYIYGGPNGDWDDTSCSNSESQWSTNLYVCQYNCLSVNCDDHACTFSGQTYTCQCPLGTTGVHCDTDLATINECESNPCINGTTCTDDLNRYICQCRAGYTGQTCEIDIDECMSSPCQNGGTCRNDIARYTCTCFNGYTGSQCETNINECASFPCQNDGTCTNLIGRFTCSCTSTFVGFTCTEDVNECNANPCRNFETCTNMIGNFSCNCPRGYTGSICQNDTDECRTNPCQHNGTCVNNPGSFACNCTAGFDGNLCDTDINECNMPTCENEGLCINSLGNYSCNCAKEFVGMHCKEDFNECDLDPCQNNGTCQNSYGSYNCTCADMYEGPNCERILATKLPRSTEGPDTLSDLNVGLLVGLILTTLSTIIFAFILYIKLRATKAGKYVNNSAHLEDMQTTEPDNVPGQKIDDAAYEVVKGTRKITDPNYETVNATSTEYENNYQILKI